MKISDSSVNMSMNHSLIRTETTKERLLYWVGERPDDARDSQTTAGQYLADIKDLIELSEEGKKKLYNKESAVSCISEESVEELSLGEGDKQKLLLLQKFMEALTGKKFRFFIVKGIRFNNGTAVILPDQSGGSSAVSGRRGWGLEYDYSKTEYERESLSYTANGIIKTQDGRTINFSLQMNMTREFASALNISIRAGDAVLKDPLVISLNGAAPQLAQDKISFDLDLDGKPDQISFVKPGSGFLALDRNGDGIINDGSELFGPATGEGFSELAAYDADNNNWIDENDPIYSRLRIWTRDEAGNTQLLALGAAGIGAIYLGNIDTPFGMKDGQNNTLGQMSNSGIYLRENGTAGTIHHIDLAL
ncbi:MAG: hypothetical protein HPY66_2705 [Firmicutes bacterium]|nr:hypothetical protein [Bacillota bacterium]